MSRMNVLILGYDGHGKDAVRKLINDLTGRSTPNIELLAARKVVFPWFQQNVPDHYENASSCYEDRNHQTQAWHRAISEYNEDDKARFIKEVLVDNSMFVGINSNETLQAVRGMFQKVFWVDRSTHLGIERTGEVMFDPNYMTIINNNGSEQDLFNEVKIACETYLS